MLGCIYKKCVLVSLLVWFPREAGEGDAEGLLGGSDSEFKFTKLSLLPSQSYRVAESPISDL